VRVVLERLSPTCRLYLVLVLEELEREKREDGQLNPRMLLNSSIACLQHSPNVFGSHRKAPGGKIELQLLPEQQERGIG
jgi:hypothetical protein